jgi:hypothetical protein
MLVSQTKYKSFEISLKKYLLYVKNLTILKHMFNFLIKY